MPALPRDPALERTFCDHLAALRWPHGFVCPRCGGKRAWRLVRRPRVFGCSACGAQTSVTAGTFFHRVRVPLHALFAAAERATIPGRTAVGLSTELGLRYGTALRLLHRARSALGLRVPQLGPPVIWSKCTVACTPPGLPPPFDRRERRQFRAHATVVTLQDADQRYRMAVAPLPTDDFLRAARLPRRRGPGAHPTDLPLRKVLCHHHRGVSADWIGVYVAAATAAWQRPTSRDDVLAAGTLYGVRALRELRWRQPPEAFHWVWTSEVTREWHDRRRPPSGPTRDALARWAERVVMTSA